MPASSDLSFFLRVPEKELPGHFTCNYTEPGHTTSVNPYLRRFPILTLPERHPALEAAFTSALDCKMSKRKPIAYHPR